MNRLARVVLAVGISSCVLHIPAAVHADAGQGAPAQDPNALPAWVKPGVRLSYYVSDGTHAGQRVRTENGVNSWFADPNGTGIAAGSAGVGIESLDLLAMDDQSIAYSKNSYLLTGVNLEGISPAMAGPTYGIAPLRGQNNCFVTPAKLQELANMKGDGVRVSDLAVEVGGRRMPALMIQTWNRESWTIQCWSKADGVLLSMSTATNVDNVTKRDVVNNQIINAGPGIATSNRRLLGMRVLPNIKPMPLPANLTKDAIFDVKGSYGGGEFPPVPYQYSLRVDSAKNGIAVVSVHTDDGFGGTQATPNAMMLCAASPLNYLINPQVYADMQAGTVIDQDRFAKTTVRFDGQRQGLMWITEQGDTWQISRGHDPRTGMIAAFYKSENVLGNQTVTQSRITPRQ